jgi:hypothetical protein
MLTGVIDEGCMQQNWPTMHGFYLGALELQAADIEHCTT